METIKFQFTESNSKAKVPAFNQQESLSFWNSYDTQCSNNIEKPKHSAQGPKNFGFGNLLGAVANAGKPKKDSD